MDCNRLFVYGTLMPGQEPAAMAHVCRRLRALGPATLRGHLYDLGPYPAIVADAAGGVVHGQVVEVDCQDSWHALDAYEGCPRPGEGDGLFRRVRSTATLASGQTLDCWVYVYERDLTRARRVENGCWLRRHE